MIKKILTCLFLVGVFSCDIKVHDKNSVVYVDPMKVKSGVVEKMTIDGSTLYKIDTTTKINKSKISIRINNDVIVFDNKSDTIKIKYSKNKGKLTYIRLQVDSANEYLEAPIKNDSSGNIKIAISTEKSLLPGIFKISISAKDSLGSYTNEIIKYIVVGGNIDIDNIKGKWNFEKFTSNTLNIVGAKFNKYHYVEFDSTNAYEWYDIDSISKHYKRSAYYEVEYRGGANSRSQAIEEHYTYKIENNHIRFYKSGDSQSGYKILTLIKDRMIVKENVGEGDRYCIMMKIK